MANYQKGQISSNCRKLKIVLLGDRSVGKSSIIKRYITNQFQQLMSPTVGVDFMTKQIKYKNNNYKLQLWDTAGQQKYRSLIKGYLKGADVCIFVYDMARPQSYEAIVDWIHIFESVSTYESFKIIAGNKSDLFQGQQKNLKALRQLKNKRKQLSQISQILISAKTGYNIEQLFQEILHQCWFCKTMQDIGTSKTIKTIGSDKNINAKQKFQRCCR